MEDSPVISTGIPDVQGKHCRNVARILLDPKSPLSIESTKEEIGSENGYADDEREDEEKEVFTEILCPSTPEHKMFPLKDKERMRPGKEAMVVPETDDEDEDFIEYSDDDTSTLYSDVSEENDVVRISHTMIEDMGKALGDNSIVVCFPHIDDKGCLIDGYLILQDEELSAHIKLSVDREKLEVEGKVEASVSMVTVVSKTIPAIYSYKRRSEGNTLMPSYVQVDNIWLCYREIKSIRLKPVHMKAKCSSDDSDSDSIEGCPIYKHYMEYVKALYIYDRSLELKHSNYMDKMNELDIYESANSCGQHWRDLLIKEYVAEVLPQSIPKRQVKKRPMVNSSESDLEAEQEKSTACKLRKLSS